MSTGKLLCHSHPSRGTILSLINSVGISARAFLWALEQAIRTFNPQPSTGVCSYKSGAQHSKSEKKEKILKSSKSSNTVFLCFCLHLSSLLSFQIFFCLSKGVSRWNLGGWWLTMQKGKAGSRVALSNKWADNLIDIKELHSYIITEHSHWTQVFSPLIPALSSSSYVLSHNSV